jgi:hypothetical protein
MRKNNYGNQFGYHNPTLTLPLLKQLSRGAKGVRFTDSSWHHDLTDSVVNMKRDIHIHFPNSEEHTMDEQTFTTFAVFINELVFTDKKSIFKSFNTVDEVIEYVQQYVNKFDKV